MRTDVVEGIYVNLRIVEINDAEFTLACRQNEKKTAYIPKVNVSLEQQRAWIQKQIESDDCYFFVIERKTGERIGTFSLYGIKGEESESGRLVMLGNQFESLETGVLFNSFSFDVAKMRIVKSEIDAENNAALGYSNRLGGRPVGEKVDEKTGRRMIIYHAKKEWFEEKLPGLQKIIRHFDRLR
jgi:RimJ/RimL family protein N-acetyltransferase